MVTTSLEDTEFSFAYIDFNAPPTPPGAGQPGDFDGDGDVDGNDFLTWQRGLGSMFDASDLADWKANFGAGAAVAATGGVPEPSSGMLLTFVLAAAAASRRHERGRD